MIQRSKFLRLLAFLFAIGFPHMASAKPVPVLESVLQKNFPAQPEVLAKTTSALFQEYEDTKNIASLIFYSYGMLRQANNFVEFNDFVNASEYAKVGFFYLDEAVDSNENDPRVRYLRARLDAYLPADIGRCVVTLNDTEILLDNKAGFNRDIITHIKYMRYRALSNCNKNIEARALLTEVAQQGGSSIRYFASSFDTAPAWDMNEVTQVLIPLVKGD